MVAPYEWDLWVVCFVLDPPFAQVGTLLSHLRRRPFDDVLWCFIFIIACSYWPSYRPPPRGTAWGRCSLAAGEPGNSIVLRIIDVIGRHCETFVLISLDESAIRDGVTVCDPRLGVQQLHSF